MSDSTAAAPNALASNEDFEFAALQQAKNYRGALLKSFAPHLKGNVLEVGAGIGQLSGELKQLPGVDRLVAVEPDSRFHPLLSQRIAEENIIRGTAANVDLRTPWNAIVSVNVLEHIENDASELALYRSILEGARGRLCLFVPARPEIYAPLDKDFGHFRRYTAKQLRSRLQDAGFEIVRLSYFNLPGYFAWWLSFRMMKRRGFSKGAVWFYDRIVFPPVFWLESTLCRPPLGQSLLVIARVRS
ncbi:MAG TPA: methyltransferase domain-containing protein [Opitutaceae bacterium]|nr:methyltransferase domain-containing protein [Opitutaceae bacterium]